MANTEVVSQAVLLAATLAIAARSIELEQNLVAQRLLYQQLRVKQKRGHGLFRRDLGKNCMDVPKFSKCTPKNSSWRCKTPQR